MKPSIDIVDSISDNRSRTTERVLTFSRKCDSFVPEGEGGRHGAGAEKCLGPAPPLIINHLIIRNLSYSGGARLREKFAPAPSSDQVPAKKPQIPAERMRIVNLVRSPQNLLCGFSQFPQNLKRHFSQNPQNHVMAEWQNLGDCLMRLNECFGTNHPIY